MSSPIDKRIRPHRPTDVGRMHEGKKQYVTEAEADVDRDRMTDRFPDFTFAVYPCLWCDFWHVGRGKKAKQFRDEWRRSK